MSRISINDWAIELANLTAKRSTCLRRNVGCIMLNKRNEILATGYNGVAKGVQHCNEGNPCKGSSSLSGLNLDGCEAIHAEQNALLQCPDVFKIKTCYVTVSPCLSCVKMLLNTSCKIIYYIDEYPHKEAIKLWLKSGRIIKQINFNK